jgi:hypothetical protein
MHKLKLAIDKRQALMHKSILLKHKTYLLNHKPYLLDHHPLYCSVNHAKTAEMKQKKEATSINPRYMVKHTKKGP